MGVIVRIQIWWLELLHWAEWRWWEFKWVRRVNGQKNYARWPQCQQATPEWKRRVKRIKTLIELRNRLSV